MRRLVRQAAASPSCVGVLHLYDFFAELEKE